MEIDCSDIGCPQLRAKTNIAKVQNVKALLIRFICGTLSLTRKQQQNGKDLGLQRNGNLIFQASLWIGTEAARSTDQVFSLSDTAMDIQLDAELLPDVVSDSPLHRLGRASSACGA
jgi:hypothetical protein